MRDHGRILDMRTLDRGPLEFWCGRKNDSVQLEQIGLEIRVEKLRLDWLRSCHPSNRNESQNAICTSPPIDMLEILRILRLDCYEIRINLDLEDARVTTDCGTQLGIASPNSVWSSTKLAPALPHATMNVTPTKVEIAFLCE